MLEGVIYWTKNVAAFAFAALLLDVILLLSESDKESQAKSNYRNRNNANNNNNESGAKNNNNGNRSSKADTNNSNDKNKDDDPFNILGLDRGNTTIEEATKARRKLALKWHPDRNIGNEEVATKKMQEINDAFLKVEKILEEGGDDDGNIRENDDDKPHNEQDARRRQRHQRQGKNAAEKAAYQQRTKFESDVKKEFHNFERARRNASKGVFNNGESPPKKSKSAKKNARQRAKKKAQQERDNNNRREAAQCRYPSGGNVGSSRNEIPFHQLPLVQRCEIKFQSKEVVKSDVFTAIRTKSYYILQAVLTTMGPYDRLPLSERRDDGGRVFVTPLMIASYLGDYTAADIILQHVGERGEDVIVGQRSNPGGYDSLALAEEARDISQLLYDEARVNLAEATTMREKKMKEKTLVECAKSFEAAEELVRRLTLMQPPEKMSYENERILSSFLTSVVETMVAQLALPLGQLLAFFGVYSS